MTHYVTFTPVPDQDPDDTSGGELVFECDEPESSDCRWTSDCDCEFWITQRDDHGVFHAPYIYPSETPPEPQERHEMHLDPQGCIWKEWWQGAAEEAFRDVCGADWPLREGRHEVTLTFDGDYLEVEYVGDPW